ncbi:PASTA domain-containing protein [Arthrobacter sp. NPDC057013]|uniref:PASTA domain-containing protein n=1 Tax=Arthrobacter sp. NPDC057013 TaxID=3345999 RepID=UPI0036305C9F
MPDVRGLSEADARQVLADAGYSQSLVKIAKVPSVVSAGTVAAQDPVAGTETPASITLSLPSPAKMPQLAGKPIDEATKALTAMGAQPSLKRIYDPGAKTGTVLTTTPAAGALLNATPALTVAGAASSVPLSSLKATGDCGAVSSGTVNGTAVTDGVRCSARKEAETTFWILGRKAAQLKATVGIDDTEPEESRVHVRILADDKVVLDRELGYGESANLDADVAGALRLDIEATKVGGSESFSSESVLLGNAVLLGSADAISALGSTP